MANNERPGIYASYYVVGENISEADGAVTVGIAAKAQSASPRTAHSVTSHIAAASLYGAQSSMTKLANAAFLNGCRSVVCACAGGDDADAQDYAEAFALLMAAKVDIIACDSDDADVHAALKQAMEAAQFAIGIAAAQDEADAMCARALAINDERVLLMDAPAETAAAFAGYLACHTDPAASLSGAELHGLGMQEKTYTDTDVNTLVRGGVIPVECVQGVSYTVRAVTTRTESGGEPDTKYREVTTLRIINTVVPAVRDALRARFSGGRNDARTRGAIRTQVMIELEKLRKRGLIAAYGDVSAVPDSEDPTVCAVSFGFQAVYALEYIELTACVTV